MANQADEAARQERLARQLRENLKRRKQQARAQGGAEQSPAQQSGLVKDEPQS